MVGDPGKFCVAEELSGSETAPVNCVFGIFIQPKNSKDVARRYQD